MKDYNEVIFECPGCSQPIVVASKGGSRSMAIIMASGVPFDDADYILGHPVQCSNCLRHWTICATTEVKTMALCLEHPEVEEEDQI